MKSIYVLFTLNILSNAFRTPIFLVPGLGGSSIRNENNKVIWPPPIWRIFAPNWLSDLTTSYNHTSNKFYLPHKNETCFELLSLYDNLITKLDEPYVMPYDFRLLGNKDYLESYYEHFKKCIENKVNENNKKCSIVAHSLGGLIMHDYLLNYCSSKWKDTYINNLVTINTPYGGSIYAVNTLHEKKIKYPYTNRDIKFSFARYVSGILWVLPNKHYLSDKMLYRDFNKNYTFSDIQDVLTFLDKEETYYLHNKHFGEKLIEINKNTNVKTHILYSTGVPTLSCISSDGFHDYDDGDGTVDVESLTLPKIWNRNNYLFKEFKGGHLSIINNKELQEYIQKIIYK